MIVRGALRYQPFTFSPAWVRLCRGTSFGVACSLECRVLLPIADGEAGGPEGPPARCLLGLLQRRLCIDVDPLPGIAVLAVDAGVAVVAAANASGDPADAVLVLSQPVSGNRH